MIISTNVWCSYLETDHINTFEERLKKLGVFSLKKRRLRSMAAVFKSLRGYCTKKGRISIWLLRTGKRTNEWETTGK